MILNRTLISIISQVLIPVAFLHLAHSNIFHIDDLPFVIISLNCTLFTVCVQFVCSENPFELLIEDIGESPLTMGLIYFVQLTLIFTFATIDFARRCFTHPEVTFGAFCIE